MTPDLGGNQHHLELVSAADLLDSERPRLNGTSKSETNEKKNNGRIKVKSDGWMTHKITMTDYS